WDPGTRYGYSGEGFEYVARFIRRKTGASLDSLARRFILQPFGMKSSSFKGSAADDFSTTIRDYGEFLAAVMNRKGLPDRYARQRDSLQAIDSSGVTFCAGKVRRCPQLAGYALGWSVLRYPNPADDVLWHTGSDATERSMVFYFPARHEGAVLLTDGANGFDSIIEAAILLFPDTPFAEYLAAGKASTNSATGDNTREKREMVQSVDFPSMRIAGVSARTSNARESNPATAAIGALWARFSATQTPASNPESAGKPVYSVYSDYESDVDGQYTVVIGRQTDAGNAGESVVTIPAGRYLEFVSNGDMPGAVVRGWEQVWKFFSAPNAPKRLYTADFEYHDPAAPTTVRIYIAVPK
ncbi:MAG TPA: effector binding domain-containing protein, partial [Gemmatimonadaceae bacterium]|nr:effector binding domain-containing protein [Gemmatimonadaceae bacterium]